MITKETLHAGITLVRAIAEAIREAGEIPSGHLYAMLTGRLTLDDYNRIIAMLKRGDLIDERNHLLIWKAQ